MRRLFRLRGPKPAAAELDLDLLELDFHTPAGVQALLTSADGASRLRLAVQAQLAHSSALAAAVRSNGILLAGILRCVHHKSRSLLRDNESEVAMAQMGPPPTTEGWGDFEATLEAKQQLLRSPSRGWKEKPPAGLRPDQEIEVTDYRERITEELADLFLSVNKVKNQVRIGVLDSYTRKLQQAMQKKGVGANLRKAKADLKAELIEEYVKSVFQELAPFCRASELAEQMERLGKLLLTVSQTGEAHPGSFVLHGALTSGSHPFFSSPAILKQAALDFQDIHDWSGSGLVGAGLQAEAGGGQGVFPPPKGPLLMACPTPKYAKKAEDFGKRDPVLEGHRRFGLYLLDDAGKLAHIWACYSPLEALRLAAVRGLGVSEIGEGVEAVGAVADILRIRWATISLALPKVESPASGGGQVKLTGAIAAAAREQALAAAQKCRSIFWGETSALKEETEHVRMKSGGRAAVSLLQLKRTIAYWRHVLVLQASRDQLTKAGKEGAAREAARLLRLSAVLSERPGQEERLPRHVGAFLRAVREDALGSVCPSMDDGSFVGVKGTAAFELPRPASRTAARPQTAREVKPSHPKVDTWLLGALLPARALSLGALTEEERKSIVVEDKKLEHALDTALGDDRGYASTMPTRVNTKVAYHLELRLVHTHMKSAFLDGEAAISDAREGRKRTSESPVNGRQSLDLTPQNSRPPLTTNSYQEWVRLRLPGWFQSYPGLTSAEHVARAELFQKLVVRPLGDVTFAAAKALESAKDGGARLIVRPPATATKEISSMEAEVRLAVNSCNMRVTAAAEFQDGRKEILCGILI